MEMESDPYFAFFSLEKESKKKSALASNYIKKLEKTLEIKNIKKSN